MEIGNVVLVLAGKEKGEIFIVSKVEKNRAFIVDGKRLKKNNPKKKNFKHIRLFTNSKMDAQILADENERVNCAIRKFLNQKRSEHV